MQRLFLVLALLASFCPVHAQQHRDLSQEQLAAEKVVALLYDLTWVSESQGRNAGPGVEMIVRGGGGEYSKSYKPEWCGFTQAYVNLKCGLPIPRNGMQGAANAWFPLAGPDAERTVYRRGVKGSIDVIAVGLKAGFDYGRGIHHVACVAELGRPVRKGRAPRTVYTLAGNEGSGTRAGLHRTLYPITSIDGLSNWNYARLSR